MSGLILAGIGKGIADAGSSFGNMMFKGIESEEADKRAMQRAEALERLKEQMIEERAQKDAAKAVEVDARAGLIGQQRAERQLGADIKGLIGKQAQIGGEAPAASEEEIRKLIEENPQYREIYRQAGYIDKAPTKNEQRLQNVEDQVQAARELGASSTLLKSYQETKKSVLQEIKEENIEKRNEQRHQETLAQNERLSKQFEVTSRIAQQNADARTTAAERPRSGGTDPNKPATTADLQRQITAAQNSLATELGVPKNDVNSEVASIKKKAAAGNAQAKATLERIQPFLDEYGDANRRMMEFKRSSTGSSGSSGSSNSGSASTNSGDNRPSRPPLSSFRG